MYGDERGVRRREKRRQLKRKVKKERMGYEGEKRDRYMEKSVIRIEICSKFITYIKSFAKSDSELSPIAS